jgi:hypothetical protein
MLISVCMTWSVQKGFLTNFLAHDNKVSMERKRDLTICVCMVKAIFVVWQWGFGGETRGHHSHIVRCVCVCVFVCLFVCCFNSIFWWDFVKFVIVVEMGIVRRERLLEWEKEVLIILAYIICQKFHNYLILLLN